MFRMKVSASISISIHAPPRGATLVFCSSFAFCPFQFTPLREGRLPIRPVHPRVRGYFNSRPSARGDSKREEKNSHTPYFNSRPSARGDSSTGMSCRPAHNFNSRPSARGDPAFLVVRLLLRHHFNSRPSARGDMEAAELAKMSQYISIHAPPRGATRRHRKPRTRFPFQFTPLREGRPAHTRSGDSEPDNFNSRPSARGDLPLFRVRQVQDISIHAPPRGATVMIPAFQPLIEFQFTPLREGRQAAELAKMSQYISIHAPPRGATDSGAEFRSAHHISIHAPPRGATTHPRHDCRHVVNFNSRPSARGDGWAGACAPLPLAFQFTPLREGRPYARTYNLM